MGNQCVIDCLRFIFLDLETLILNLKQNFHISIKHLILDKRFHKQKKLYFSSVSIPISHSHMCVCKIIL